MPLERVQLAVWPLPQCLVQLGQVQQPVSVGLGKERGQAGHKMLTVKPPSGGPWAESGVLCHSTFFIKVGFWIFRETPHGAGYQWEATKIRGVLATHRHHPQIQDVESDPWLGQCSRHPSEPHIPEKDTHNLRGPWKQAKNEAESFSALLRSCLCLSTWHWDFVGLKMQLNPLAKVTPT